MTHRTMNSHPRKPTLRVLAVAPKHGDFASLI
jgi:hypothetical protein